MNSKVVCSIALVLVICLALPHESSADERPRDLKDSLDFITKPAQDAMDRIKKGLEDIYKRLSEFEIFSKTNREINEAIERTKKSAEELYKNVAACVKPCPGGSDMSRPNTEPSNPFDTE